MKNRILILFIFCFIHLGFLNQAFAAQASFFETAKPIWPKGRTTVKNLFVGFRAIIDRPAVHPTKIRLTASTLYRLRVNGKFVGHGPARGPHDYYRVDEWNLTDHLKENNNIIAIEVAGYNANSYYILDQPSFLQAEVFSGSDVLASTAGKGQQFQAMILEHKLKKVQRYSFQRPFSEVYSLYPDFDDWIFNPKAKFEPVECKVTATKNLIPRRVPYSKFVKRPPVRQMSKGRFEMGLLPSDPWKNRSLTQIGPELKGYAESKLTKIPSLEMQRVRVTSMQKIDKPMTENVNIQLGNGDFYILDMGTNLSGFIGARISCSQNSKFVITFDEILSDGDVDFKRMGCVNIIDYEMQAGTYEIESFEPYTMRYVKLHVLQGNVDIQNVYLREFVSPDVYTADFSASDMILNDLFRAARETYRQNSIDIFMDCPSRERAGWLCDSYFTSRVAMDLSGHTKIEKNFYENYLLPDSFPNLPEGMIPMCYPADHYNGNFIPNWAMWFIVQLEEYLHRSNDKTLVNALEPRVASIFNYFKNFENSDGLLEKLKKWVFIEWSAANKFVQDVNYPTNMLYAGALEAAGRLYHRPTWTQKAKAIKETIREQSFDGTFFVDNAVRNNGSLDVTRNRSEVCQYFAFYFRVATPELYPELWNTLIASFGPQRERTNAYPEIHPANAFIGNYLRMELLSRWGRCSQIVTELKDYFLKMAERTGTLWENKDERASCNHGFASHVAHVLYRDVLGFDTIDYVNKSIKIKFSAVPLDWCEGQIPVQEGRIYLKWWKEQGNRYYQLQLPEGYEWNLENPDQLNVIFKP